MRVRVVVVLMVAIAGLTGCDLTPQGSSERPSETANVVTDVSRLERTKLLVWLDTPEVAVPLTREFERRHPNIDVDIVVKSYEDLLNTAKLALSSERAPDVMTVDQGPGSMGELARAGLIRPLDRYAEAYGWTDEFPPTLIAINSISDDGSRIGSGSLYGLSEFGEMVGLFYNEAKLRALGLSLPRTFAELEAMLPRIRAAGEVPIQFGNQDRVLGELAVQALADAFGGDDDTRALVYGRSGASYDGAYEQAAEQLRAWAEDDVFPGGYAGTDEVTAEQKFGRGEGVFYLSGTWASPVLARALGDDVGFMPLPGAQGPAPMTGGPSLPFTITSRSDSPDAAAAWIDFMVGTRHAELARRLDQLPALPIPTGDRQSVFDDIHRAWVEANNEERIVPYVNFATRGINTLLPATVQELLGGRISPAQLVEKLQDDYDASKR